MLGCPGVPGQCGTGQVFHKVGGVPEATTTPHAHAAAGMSPHPVALRASWQLRCRNHKVEMKFWWNKQPQTKKGRMEVKGAGLQGWGSKVVGRDRGL